MKLILKESQLSLSEGSVVNILGLVGLTLEVVHHVTQVGFVQQVQGVTVTAQL